MTGLESKALSQGRRNLLPSPWSRLWLVVIGAVVGGVLLVVGPVVVHLIGALAVAAAGILAWWIVISAGVEYGIRRARDE